MVMWLIKPGEKDQEQNTYHKFLKDFGMTSYRELKDLSVNRKAREDQLKDRRQK